MHTTDNEPGTPVYQVNIDETRAITVQLSRTVLGGTSATAEQETREHLARAWQQMACESVTVGDVIEQRDDPWHLFRIDASDADGVHGFIVSAQSASEAKAQELAEAAVLDDIGTEDEPGTIDECIAIGTTDTDVFEHFGPM